MIHLSHLCKRFGATVAVDDLTIEIAEGEVFGLLGPNGAGKTTTVGMMVGLLEPDSGTVELTGRGSPARPDVRSQIGIVPQALSLYEDLSGEENLAFFGRMQGIAGETLASRVQAALEFVDLSDRRKDRVKAYSGGMQRRLNLAVALVHEPRVLLLDEPTVGVDPQSRNAIFDNIEKLKGEGRTIVYTTHYMEEAQRLCDRVAIIDHGKLLAMDTVRNLIDAHGGTSVVTAERDDGDIRVETDQPLDRLLELRRDGGLRRFAVESPSLESVFLNLTGRHLRD